MSSWRWAKGASVISTAHVVIHACLVEEDVQHTPPALWDIGLVALYEVVGKPKLSASLELGW